MKHIKSLKEITEICKEYGIENWELESDGKIRVDGDVNLWGKGLTEIPLDFSYVSGDFYCDGNKLTSLEGCPKEIGGNFWCFNNKLTSLEGCPKEVGGGFYCHSNQLTSLKGCPKEVGGSFDCNNNQIKDLAIDYRIDVGRDIWLGVNPLPREILNLNQAERHWLFKYGYEYWHLWHDGKLNLRWWKELRLSMDEELNSGS